MKNASTRATSSITYLPTQRGAMYDDVYEHLVHGRPLGVTLKQVRQQIAVMEEAHRQNPMSRLTEEHL